MIRILKRPVPSNGEADGGESSLPVQAGGNSTSGSDSGGSRGVNGAHQAAAQPGQRSAPMMEGGSPVQETPAGFRGGLVDASKEAGGNPAPLDPKVLLALEQATRNYAARVSASVERERDRQAKVVRERQEAVLAAVSMAIEQKMEAAIHQGIANHLDSQGTGFRVLLQNILLEVLERRVKELVEAVLVQGIRQALSENESLLDKATRQVVTVRALREGFRNAFEALLLPKLEDSTRMLIHNVQLEAASVVTEKTSGGIETAEKVMSEAAERLRVCKGLTAEAIESMSLAREQTAVTSIVEEDVCELIRKGKLESATTLARQSGNQGVLLDLAAVLRSETYENPSRVEEMVSCLSGEALLTVIDAFGAELKDGHDATVDWIYESVLALDSIQEPTVVQHQTEVLRRVMNELKSLHLPNERRKRTLIHLINSQILTQT